ncbi:hypothetical protein GCM10020367_47190 [Streptomyces sannanensis]|uniref:Integral membrane protein n=1 Tax=Streptomyces sannanensis TaxID=285536 RepID=A0ABP6SGD0_9ACTN
MLALRLARGSHPLVLLRRLLVAASSAGTGFLLLCTLSHAVAHPEQSAQSSLRLLWCAVPLAATAYLAVAVARTDPSTRPRPGLSAIGLGPVRLTAIAAASTALCTALGSMLALLLFLQMRGGIGGLPLDGAAAGLLAAGRPLPLGAALILLSLTPVIASCATALALCPRRTKPGKPGKDPAQDGTEPAPPPAGLPWGVALTTAGLAMGAYAANSSAPDARSALLPLPGELQGSPAGVLAGWLVAAIGLAMAGPGLTHLCGRFLQAARPGAVRLLAGRALQAEARRIGRPLGVLCAVAAATYTAANLYAAAGKPPAFGPLTGLGAALVMGCTVATLLTAALETTHDRAGTRDTMLRLGAPAKLLRAAAALRAVALLALFAPVTWLVGELAVLPLSP